MTSERRHFARVAFDAPAQLTTDAGTFEVKMLDLSFKGALISQPVSGSFVLGAPCELAVQLADVDARIAMLAEVAHVEPGQLGLLCKSIDLDSMTHLRRLIEMNLGTPDLLEREFKALVSR